MTRLPSAAFLPSGAFESDMSLSMHNHSYPAQSLQKRFNGDSHGNLNGSGYGYGYGNHASPSSIPRAQSNYPLHLPHLDSTSPSLQSLPSLAHSDTGHLSLASMRAAASQTSRIPSHLQFEIPQDYRVASPSPTRIGRTSERIPPSSSIAAEASRPISHIPPGVVSGSLSRSVSVDAVGSASHSSSVHLIQRLTQQNASIREAWEAERNYLEANRRRAEEVYQEERAIMEDVREGWENERAELYREMQALKERVQRLEGENSALKTMTAQVTGVVSPLAGQVGESTRASENSSLSGPSNNILPRSPNPGYLSMHNVSSLPPGLDAASRRPHHFACSGSSRTSPTALPESASTFTPLAPRVEPQQNTYRDFLTSLSPDDSTPVPVIDVQEIDPKLEGISLKATAVQRPTFGVEEPLPEDTQDDDQGRPELTKRGSSKDQTLQVLAAAEHKRLIMHAGHTPSHSLSILPTVNATEVNTIDSHSERATPIPETADSVNPDDDNESCSNIQGKGKEVEGMPQVASDEPFLEDYAEDPEELYDAPDDVPLKGPLMIRNMPAKDEIFWEAVNKKLQPISQGQNALPTVMQSSSKDTDTSAGPSGCGGQHEAAKDDNAGGDAPKDSAAKLEDEPGKSKDSEGDVPLRIRNTTNFGAPFGVM